MDNHDLQLVFIKDLAQSLPPHHPYNCCIDLLWGAPLKSCHLFNLSRLERQTMESYISDSLNAGIIHHSSSPLCAVFFFVSKKDGTLHHCIGLSQITIKNKCSLLLSLEASPPSVHLLQARATLIIWFVSERGMNGWMHSKPILAVSNIWSCLLDSAMPLPLFRTWWTISFVIFWMFLCLFI